MRFGGGGSAQSVTSSENLGFRRIIDNNLIVAK